MEEFCGVPVSAELKKELEAMQERQIKAHARAGRIPNMDDIQKDWDELMDYVDNATALEGIKESRMPGFKV